MALTLKAEQSLDAVGLVQFFDDNKAEWAGFAKLSYAFCKNNFPDHAVIRRDDVAKALEPILEVNKKLTTKLAQKKLTQKYWKTYFTDLVIDRVWTNIKG